MRVFISDLHLGDGSKSDDFHRDNELIKFLEWTDNRAKEIVIVGDLYELWQSKLEKIFWAHADVIRALDERRDKIYFVHGNHDALPFAKLTPSQYMKDGVCAVHGHQFDEFNNYENPLLSLKWPIGKYITALVAGLEKIIHPDSDVWLKKMYEKFGDFKVTAALLQNKGYNITDLDEHISVIEKLRQQCLADITIMGHSHNAELCNITEHIPQGPNMPTKPGKRIYANTGTWVDGEYPTFVAVTSDEVQIRDGLSYDVLKKVSII